MHRPLFRHDLSRAHDTGPGHPERAARIVAVEEALATRGWCGYAPADAPAATDEQLLRVHAPHHVAAVRRLAAAGGGAVDGDTTVSPGSWDAACRAAGGAVAMVDALLTGGADRAAAIHRPPGHHCETDRAMGFCLLNAVAVGAAHAVALGRRRVLVLDWDVHHGNGTAEIFAARADVLVASIHQQPLYPGTGRAAERGTGAGAGLTLNLPVPPGTGDADYAALVEHVVVPAARGWAPELVLVSAGFDAHRDDPLAGCRVTDAGFRAMAGAVGRLAAELEAPVGLILEGGYDLGVLGRCVPDVLEVLAGDPAAAPPPAEPTPLARAAAAALVDAPGPLRA